MAKNTENKISEKDNDFYTLLIVEDNNIHGACVRVLLEQNTPCKVIGQVGTAQEAYAEFEKHDPNLVIVDIGLPNTNGILVAKKLKRKNPKAKVLVLTAHPDEGHVYEAFSAGVDGYLTKESMKDELFLAAQYVLAGYKYVSPIIADKIIDIYLEKRREMDFNGLDELSPREIEVLVLTAKKMSGPEIGALLKITPKTVERHRTNIAKKAGLEKGAWLVDHAANLIASMKNKNLLPAKFIKMLAG